MLRNYLGPEQKKPFQAKHESDAAYGLLNFPVNDLVNCPVTYCTFLGYG